MSNALRANSTPAPVHIPMFFTLKSKSPANEKNRLSTSIHSDTLSIYFLILHSLSALPMRRNPSSSEALRMSERPRSAAR